MVVVVVCVGGVIDICILLQLHGQFGKLVKSHAAWHQIPLEGLAHHQSKELVGAERVLQCTRGYLEGIPTVDQDHIRACVRDNSCDPS